MTPRPPLGVVAARLGRDTLARTRLSAPRAPVPPKPYYPEPRVGYRIVRDGIVLRGDLVFVNDSVDGWGLAIPVEIGMPIENRALVCRPTRARPRPKPRRRKS